MKKWESWKERGQAGSFFRVLRKCWERETLTVTGGRAWVRGVCCGALLGKGGKGVPVTRRSAKGFVHYYFRCPGVADMACPISALLLRPRAGGPK